MLIRHDAKSPNAQEECLSTSFLFVMGPYPIKVRLHVQEIDVVILTSGTAGTVGT